MSRYLIDFNRDGSGIGASYIRAGYTGQSDPMHRVDGEPVSFYDYAAAMTAVAARSTAARNGSGESGHIDHTPGGSPDPYTDAAPAPRYTVATTYRPMRKRTRKTGEPMDWREALSRCTAAARLELSAEVYSAADRDACTADGLDRLAASIPGGYSATTFPPEWATMTRLRNYAANYRRAVERTRNRADDIDTLAEDAFTLPGIMLADADPTTVGTPYSAADRAADMLDRLGLDPTGDGFPMAYSAARSAQVDDSGESIDPATVAAELGMSRAAVRKSAERSRDRMPSIAAGMTRGDHGSALDLTGPGARQRSMPDRDARDWQCIPAPVTVRRDRRKPVRPWSAATGKRAGWTYALTAPQHRRLTIAATMQRARLNALTAGEREIRRAALDMRPAR